MTALPAWLQAGAAALQAAATIALYKITKQYVHLTARLAAASEAQVELLRAARDEKRSAALERLRSLAKELHKHLHNLPDGGQEAQRRADSLIKNAMLPGDEELKELCRLAAAVGPKVGELAQTATENFRWLLKWARQVQAAATNPVAGFDYRLINWNEWRFRWTEADQALAKLANGG